MNIDPVQHKGRPGRGTRAPMSEINVTPLVDVMLVLLVVFMITAPLLTTGVSVNPPEADAEPIPGNDEPIVVTVQADGRVLLLDTPVEIGTLAAKLAAIQEARSGQRVFVRGDRDVDYGRIMEVIGLISASGQHRVALVTIPPNSDGP